MKPQPADSGSISVVSNKVLILYGVMIQRPATSYQMKFYTLPQMADSDGFGGVAVSAGDR